MLIPKGKNNLSKKFKFYKDESILKKQKIKKNYRDLVYKNSDTKSYAKDGLSRYTL